MGSEARGIGMESPWGNNGTRISFTQPSLLRSFPPSTFPEVSTDPPLRWSLCVSPDADSWGAESRAPKSADWGCGYAAGCPGTGWLLLCCLEDGGAAAAATGLRIK